MEVVVTGHNFESILPKDHPCHAYFKLTNWFQRRKTGKFSDFIFPKHLGYLDLPIMRGSNFSPVKLAQNAGVKRSLDLFPHGQSSSLIWRSWSPDTILKVYYPRTIHAMLTLN
jgi:hypothetical protein